MAERIRVRELMRTEFHRISVDETLGAAMAAVRAAQAVAGLPNALMVVDAEQRYVGMLTAKLLIRALVGGDDVEGLVDAKLLERAAERLATRIGDAQVPEVPVVDAKLLERAAERLATRIGDAQVPEVPVVAPGDRLLAAIRRGIALRLDFVPVVEDGRPVGLAPITALFQSAAGIALTPEHEGIRFDRKG